MDREKLFKALFKCNEKGEQKFVNFSQLTPVCKRIIFLVINLALGTNEPKTSIEWLIEKNIISGSNSDKRTIQNVIHHWKVTCGEIFQKYDKSSTSKEPFSCDIIQNDEKCDDYEKQFVQNSPLNTHISSVHEGKKPYFFDICNNYFNKKAKLNEHIASTHSDKKKLQSLPLTDSRLKMIKEQCGRYSLTQLAKYFPINLNTLRNKINKLNIEFPKSPFGSQCSFCESEKENQVKQIFKCDICHKEFPKKMKLKNHISSVHDDKKPHKCELCPSYFSQKSFLTMHINSAHEKSDDHEKEYVQNSPLNTHISPIHEGKKPHVCDICNKSYGKKDELDQHFCSSSPEKDNSLNLDILRVPLENMSTPKTKLTKKTRILFPSGKNHTLSVHDDKKPYKCEVCLSHFGQKSFLTMHIKSVHEKSDDYEKEFVQNSLLDTHISSVHEGKKSFGCNICNKSFGKNMNWINIFV